MGTKAVPRRNGDMDADKRWHLDKRIPVAFLVAILIQTGTAFWWAATISERINNLEKRAEMVAPQGDRLTRVEVNLETLKEGVNEIKRLLQSKR